MFLPPPAGPLFFHANESFHGVELNANLAFDGQHVAIHDQFRTAGLASLVFFGAVLSEVPPLPALASHLVPW
jgi:hypothetical protein